MLLIALVISHVLVTSDAQCLCFTADAVNIRDARK